MKQNKDNANNSVRKVKVKVDNPCTGPDRPWGFQEFEVPRLHDNCHKRVVRLSAPRACRLYLPGNIPGTHFCQKFSRPQGHSAAGRIMSMKNSNDIWNRTPDLRVCSAVPQSTACTHVSTKGAINVEETLCFLCLGPINWQIGLNHCCLHITSVYTAINLSCLFFYSTHLYLSDVNQLPLFLFSSLLSENNGIGVAMFLYQLTIAKLSTRSL